jgi:type II secretory pathway pseudopilin PulG
MLAKKIIKRKVAGEAGFSLIEYIIAFVIVGIAIITWLGLTVTGVKNGTFVKKVADARMLATDKASDLIKQTDALVANIPNGQTSIGSIFPNAPMAGYYDMLDENGNPYDPNQANSLPKYTRQWIVIKDLPDANEVTIFVSIVYEKNTIARFAKAVKIDGVTTVSSPS